MCYELYNKPWRFYILLVSVARKLMTSFSKQRSLRVVEGGSVIPLYWQHWRDANCTVEGVAGLPTAVKLYLYVIAFLRTRRQLNISCILLGTRD
jgi:hypothetical protein